MARYLAERVGCTTLFATHYRELARLAEEVPGVVNLHAAAREWKGEVVFLYRILPGVAERSYGVHVAKLAQVPEEVLQEAERVLRRADAAVPPAAGAAPSLLRRAPGPATPPGGRPRPADPLEALDLLYRLKREL